MLFHHIDDSGAQFLHCWLRVLSWSETSAYLKFSEVVIIRCKHFDQADRIDLKNAHELQNYMLGTYCLVLAYLDEPFWVSYTGGFKPDVQTTSDWAVRS